MTKYRIRVHTAPGYRGYFWDVDRTDEESKEYGWRRVKGGYAFTKWGARMAAKRKVRERSKFIPYESIQEL